MYLYQGDIKAPVVFRLGLPLILASTSNPAKEEDEHISGHFLYNESRQPL